MDQPAILYNGDILSGKNVDSPNSRASNVSKWTRENDD